MTWSDFYLICFLVGFLLSVLSFLLGSVHMPGIHVHGGNLHVHLGHGHGPEVHVGHLHANGGEQASAISGPHFSFLNFGTIAAFLTWFGGAGFVLTRYSSVWLWFGLVIAVVIGVVGASIVFWFVAKVLMKHEQDLNPADYDMVGVLGRVCSGIRAGGTGEIIYSQEGTRRTCGARSEGGTAIEKGIEVVVTRYERGIAYVRRWEELTGEQSATRDVEAK